MHWFMLLLAIGVEVIGTTALKMSGGSVANRWFVIAMSLYFLSIALLTYSLKVLPVGTAYALWAGLGTGFITLIGIIWFQEPADALRLLFIGLIIIGSVGLKVIT